MTARRLCRRSALWLGAVLGVVLCGALAPLAAQQTGPAKSTRCTLVEQATTRLSVDSNSMGKVAFVGGGALFKCPGRGITVRGDSAEQYPDHDAMIGNAVYDEPRFHVTSDFLNYFPDSEKVVAVGNVNARMPSGSTLVGPLAIWRRAVPRVRTHAEMEAKARPTITVIQRDSAGRAMQPMTVVADSVLMEGDSLIYARGRVVITRPDITATADSAFIDELHETMRLTRDPELKGIKDRPFSLKGDVIDLFSTNRKLQRVIAKAHAIAVSDSMTLKSDTIDLRLKAELLDHAYVWGNKSRASAVSPTQNILADSLDVTMPGQQMQLVRALRKAFAQTKPDTAKYRLDKGDSTDWIRGDTIIAHFDTARAKPAPNVKVTASDTGKGPKITQLVASGHASSLYHLPPSDSSERRPAINYVVARAITVDFAQQRASTVTTVDSVMGLFIEPTKVDSAGKRAPGTATPAKTPPKPTTPASVVPLPPKKP